MPNASPILLTLVLAAATLAPRELRAQTCSCAGAPLIGVQSAGTPSAGTLLAGITYAYNDISALYAGSTRLNDRSTQRSTSSILLELSYGVADRLSIATTFTFVHKNRTTGLGTVDSPTTLSTTGFGDGVLLLQYVLRRQDLWSRYHLSIGTGVKAPLGASGLERADGLPLNADMQPGTGAWDGLLWTYAAATLSRATPLELFWRNSYRHTGTNSRFGPDDRYRFGSEWTSLLGVGGALLGRLSYAGQISFRTTRTDRLNGSLLPNTGGRWLDLAPALDVALGRILSARVMGRLPVWQHLEGTQPTTAWALNVSLFVNLNERDEGFTRGAP